MSKVALTLEQFQIVSDILGKKHPVILFGSRVLGTHKKFSDLDICLKSEQKVPLAHIADLKYAFNESDLPYTVDVIDYHRISPTFQKIVDDTGISLEEVAKRILA